VRQSRQLTAEEVTALRVVPLSDELPNRVPIAMVMTDATQTDIAEGTGLSQATISDIRNGNYVDLKHSTLKKLAAFFGCQIEDLFPPTNDDEESREQRTLPFASRKAAALR
jgi:transcriptional regulator with XRE-family HTH domain